MKCPHWIWACLPLTLAMFFLMFFLSGCSSLGPAESWGGGASYTLERDADSCSITVNSSREVASASVSVDGSDCSMTADVGPMGGALEDLFVDMTRRLMGAP